MHHIIPIFIEGKDNLNNLITLYSSCHHYASNKKEEFEKYMKEEMDRTLINLIKA